MDDWKRKIQDIAAKHRANNSFKADVGEHEDSYRVPMDWSETVNNTDKDKENKDA